PRRRAGRDAAADRGRWRCRGRPPRPGRAAWGARDPGGGRRRRLRHAPALRAQGAAGGEALMLHEHDARTLRRLRASQLPMLAVGALLFLLGAGYMLWSVERVRGTPAVMERDAFDRPIARLARFVEAAEERLSRVRPVTRLEASLLEEVRAKT